MNYKSNYYFPNRIFVKILDSDSSSVHPFVKKLGHDHEGVQKYIFK